MCGGHKWVAEAVFDDAIIRKECADKADRWFGNNPEEWGVRIEGDEPVAHVNLTSLRAAIEGRS